MPVPVPVPVPLCVCIQGLRLYSSSFQKLFCASVTKKEKEKLRKKAAPATVPRTVPMRSIALSLKRSRCRRTMLQSARLESFASSVQKYRDFVKKKKQRKQILKKKHAAEAALRVLFAFLGGC